MFRVEIRNQGSAPIAAAIVSGCGTRPIFSWSCFGVKSLSYQTLLSAIACTCHDTYCRESKHYCVVHLIFAPREDLCLCYCLCSCVNYCVLSHRWHCLQCMVKGFIGVPLFHQKVNSGTCLHIAVHIIVVCHPTSAAAAPVAHKRSNIQLLLLDCV